MHVVCGSIQFHIMDRVRRNCSPSQLPPQVSSDPLKVAMHKKIVGDSLIDACGNAGRYCEMEVIGGTRKGIIELVDNFLNEVVVYDITDDRMVILPTWQICKYGSLLNR